MNIESIQLVSDLHLHGGVSFHDDFFRAESEVLVIAGDLCEVGEVKKFHTFLDRVNRTWKKVFYVLGNHEHYLSVISNTADQMKVLLSQYPNIELLDNEYKIVDDVVFAGTTLWTDMNGGCPITDLACRRSMNDYNYIYSHPRGDSVDTITSSELRELFRKGYRFLMDKSIAFDGAVDADRLVIITHHAPSFRSIHHRYKHTQVNHAFATDLDNLVMDSGASLWFHGHVHDCFDYNIGDTRVVANPLGYSGERFRSSLDYRPQLIELER